jgi:flavodoxin
MKDALQRGFDMKTLIAYYSRTGHTEQVAKEIAARCQADVDRIRDDGVDRSGLWGYLCSGWQAFSGATPAIHRAARNPAEYDLVVIGTPVWNWSLAAPVRTYALRHAGKFKQVAFFCTEGASGDRRVFDELQRICGRQPLATVVVKERELEPPKHAQPLKRFLAHLAA